MFVAVHSFLSLFLSVLMLTTGSGLLSSLLSVSMAKRGYPEQLIGAIMSGYSLGAVFGIFWCQRIIERVGHIRAFAFFAGSVTSISLLHGLLTSAWLWAVLRFSTGVCLTGLYMVVESWLNEKSDAQLRGRILSIYMILVYLGVGAGQFLLKAASLQSMYLWMLCGILFSLCLAPICLTQAVHPEPVNISHYNPVKLFKLAPFSMFGSFSSGLITGGFYAMGPIVCLRTGHSVTQVAWFMSISIWAGLFFQWPVGKISDRIDRLTVLAMLGLISGGVSVLLLATTGVNFILLLVLTCLFGPIFTIYPVAVARAQDNLKPADILPASAALILFYGMGAWMGPLIASTVMAMYGPNYFYAFTAVCGGSLGIAALSCRKRRMVSVADQVPLLSIPRTSAMVNTLDPRVEEPVD